VLLIDKVEHAVPLARALAKGGLPAIEITLRTAAALDAIRAVASEVPEAIVGAGTILNAKHYEDAAKAGSRFIVSPGATKYILAAANDSDVPLLPAAITPSEMLALREEGYTHLKFFPAEQAGGASFLKAMSSPLAGTFFCPTGGISLANAKTLSLAAKCDLRRRFMGCTKGIGRSGQLGRHHEACKRSRWLERLIVKNRRNTKGPLKHFQIKWEPVLRSEMRKNK
jgi:2-dehydro-3-deoxyphosphogluconate aldolase/(4S)-4-hydroxy-2-oxoglutarate aldolase